MPLAMLSIGEKRTILDFKGKDDMKRHLQDLGFVKGEPVEVLGDNASGMILRVKGVKIALNRGLATRIIVTD